MTLDTTVSERKTEDGTDGKLLSPFHVMALEAFARAVFLGGDGTELDGTVTVNNPMDVFLLVLLNELVAGFLSRSCFAIHTQVEHANTVY